MSTILGTLLWSARLLRSAKSCIPRCWTSNVSNTRLRFNVHWVRLDNSDSIAHSPYLKKPITTRSTESNAGVRAAKITLLKKSATMGTLLNALSTRPTAENLKLNSDVVSVTLEYRPGKV